MQRGAEWRQVVKGRGAEGGEKSKFFVRTLALKNLDQEPRLVVNAVGVAKMVR